jgi:CubicO group peptidase (beta-lactamase class C family)
VSDHPEGPTAGNEALFAAVDARVASHHRRQGQPGLAYGIILDGALVHSGGLGEQWAGGPVPGAGTVFRIASMTKSFTAAAVLALRDDGALALSDLAEEYVPQLRGMRLPTADSPRLCLRHLLTMTGGFPADDPWGDRQQGLPLPEFAEFLSRGASFAWVPGTRFEYSNLGYAILGLVITAVTGAPYPDFVTSRLLRPLGMSATGFEAADFDAERLARGHHRATGAWAEVAFDPCGAFAPMGGVFSCVTDLARWVSGFAAAFPPGAPPDGGPHPLARASRREMQLPQVALPPSVLARLPGDPQAGGPVNYGFGLFVEEDPEWGRIAGHSGGYPGFGTNMCWHPATGTGVVVLANGTYAPSSALSGLLLRMLMRARAGSVGNGRVNTAAYRVDVAPAGPWPATLAAREAVGGLLRSWDDAAAGALFTPNVAQDEPYSRRQRKIALIRERIGEFADDPSRPAEHDTPAHCRWWLRGERGTVGVEIALSPQNPPRVMSLRLAVPPAPGSGLAALFAAVVALLNSGAREWPPAVAVTPAVDTGLLLRQLRMAAAWAGDCTVGAFRAGDGQGSVTAELSGEHATVVISLAAEPGTGALSQADILLGP